MRIGFQQLIRLPVVTVSGQRLGHVIDAEIATDTHHVVAYVVGRGRLLSKDSYHIAPLQIKSISEDTIVVEDAASRQGTTDPAPANTGPMLSGVMPRSKSTV